MSTKILSIRGASEHNLQQLDLDLPHGKLIAFSGVSGSGKTSLVFDTIYAESRRRFLVALDRTEQGVMRRLRSPRVGSLEGLAPAVAIGQGGMRPNPRATVATLAGIYDYLRLLFARLGTPRCTVCGAEVRAQRFETVHETAAGMPEGTKLLVLAPHRLREGERESAFLEWVDRSGYRRIRVDGKMLLLEEVEPAEIRGKRLQVVVDRLVVKPDTVRRLKGSLQAALEVGDGQLSLVRLDREEELSFSVRPSCSACGAPFQAITPALFSFNSSQGACPECRGLGCQSGLNFERIFDAGRATIEEALGGLWQEFGHADLQRGLVRFCARREVEIDAPVGEWEEGIKSRLWDGEGRRGGFTGVNRWLERIRSKAAGEELSWLEAYLADSPCAACEGTRLRPEALAVEIEGEHIAGITGRSIEATGRLFEKLRFEGAKAAIGETVAAQIGRGLRILQELGLGYLGLDRRADSLSSGEFQRLRLGAALGAGMAQVLYVLDEPSVGLHARDAARLLGALEELRDGGNTILVVEHDQEILRHADLVVDLGPGAGGNGGRLMAAGRPAEVATSGSVTGRYLGGTLRLEEAKERPLGSLGWLHLEGAKGHNLKDVNVDFPLGNLVCVTGVSGSGKSSLIGETLRPLLAAHLQNAERPPLSYTACRGLEHLERVVAVDQRPIGRSSRSNAATYTGLMAAIRRLYAELPEARLRAYRPGHFSFNAPEGACAECKGSGVSAVRQGMLEDLEMICRSCGGRRYRGEVLDIRFRERNIAEVLEMSADEARAFFDAIPEMARRLQLLVDVGLGYLRLGQSSTSFSGGEAQRVKLAAELGRPQQAHTLYILDEPTTGLHLEDVRFLLELLQRLVDESNTVIVVEHHIELIAAADFAIDLGPEGGEAGGEVVVTGRPREVAACEASWTGRYLERHFAERGEAL